MKVLRRFLLVLMSISKILISYEGLTEMNFQILHTILSSSHRLYGYLNLDQDGKVTIHF